MELTTTKEQDYLDQDPPLRGQNYVCLSFISPEDVIKKKEIFYFEEFMKNFSKEMNEFFDRLGEKYKEEIDVVRSIKERYGYVFDSDKMNNEYSYFLNDNESSLNRIYYETNNYQTSIRGLKVRGVFDTMREAEIRCQVLKKIDAQHNVYVAQTGVWCPWSPNPNDIEDQQYAETHLNTLMKNYKDNQDKKDIFYEERKRELQFIKTKDALKEKDAWTVAKEASGSASEVEISEVSQVSETPVTVDIEAPAAVDIEAPAAVDIEAPAAAIIESLVELEVSTKEAVGPMDAN